MKLSSTTIAIAAFLAGVSVTLLGTSYSAPNTETPNAPLKDLMGDLFGPPMNIESREPMAWSGYPDIMLDEFPREPSFGLVPAIPSIQITPNDIDTMCVRYIPDTALEISFFPKPEFGENLIRLAEDTLSKNGAAIPFLFVTEERTLVGRWGVTQRSLDDFREQEAIFRTEFSKNLLNHFTIVFPAMQYRDSIAMLNKWARKVEQPLEVCPGPVIKEAEVWDFIDNLSHDGLAAELFRKDKPAPDRALYPED